MPHGYHGLILHVDLTKGNHYIETPKEEFYRKYMGGSALGAYYLLNNLPIGIDALSPENILIVSLSVVTGSPISGMSRVTVMAKSPLTGAIGDSQAGGFFPAQMKFSGFDAIVISGKSEHPIYLYINNQNVEIRPASHLWGKPTGIVESLIKEELGNLRVEVLQCGLAGENLVRYSAAINMSSRANGRTGMGAVMGSKNLKAIVVQGNIQPSLADKKSLLELSRWGVDNLKISDLFGLSLFGTASILNSQNASGGLPTNNWSSGSFQGAGKINGEILNREYVKKRGTCYSCSVRCKRTIEIEEGPYNVDSTYGGPEYETLAVFGSCCGNDNLESIIKANQLCNMYGLDTISCGMTIAWAMECFDKGIISIEDTNGLNLNFGNYEVIVRLIEMIAHREGFGNILAEGSTRAAKIIGRGSQNMLVASKGQEFPAHMPQVKPSLGLIYAVNPIGADHESSQHDSTYSAYKDKMIEIGLENPQPANVLNKEKVQFALVTQYWNSCVDSLDLCQFVFGPSFQLYKPNQLVKSIQAITGWNVDIDELLKVGERRLNMLRMLNYREGFTRNDDLLPKKLSEPLLDGKSAGFYFDQVQIEEAKNWYYSLAGWSIDSGIPTLEKLTELGLDWVMEHLK